MRELVIAKYIRLSLDDTISDSLSIPNQRLLLDRHIDSLNIPNMPDRSNSSSILNMPNAPTIRILEFVDNGYTGTNMERPALQEMLDLVRSGGVNCIIVKDFSRFARNEIESSYYLEQVFPIFRIRFIAVSDDFDSNDYPDGMGGIEVAFKFLMHEQYSRDLSQKIKSARRVKMKSGDNVVANAIYGYQKNMASGKWEPDDEAAEVVKLIFRLALDSTPILQIRQYLGAAKYPTPREYMNLKRGKDIVPNCAWAASTINNILENEQYIGSYVSGKYEQKGIASKSHFVVAQSEWIVIPDNHPPLVSKEDFAAVQKLLGRIRSSAKERPLKKLLDNECNSFRSRMISGNVITGTPSYGYASGENGQWIIHEVIASRVREIFALYLQGLSFAEIAEKLRGAEYPSPLEHIKLTRGQTISPQYKWTEHNVRAVLKNVQYTGAYVSGKVRQDYETNKIHKMSECDWIIIPDKHPAIISTDVYEQAQKLMQIARSSRTNAKPRDLLLGGGILKCGCCGHTLSYSPAKKSPQYYCSYTTALPDAKCHKLKVDAHELEKAVLATIKKQAEVVIGSDDLSGFSKMTAETQLIADCENRIKELSEQRQECYERFMQGELDKEAFLSMKSDCTAQIDDINNQVRRLRQVGRDREAKSKIVAMAKEVISEAATPKDIVNALVERVSVFPDNRLEIHWKFENFA